MARATQVFLFDLGIVISLFAICAVRKSGIQAMNTAHVFTCTTDGGSNEIACRKLINVLTKDVDNVLFLENTCMEHSHHLITMGSLQLVDSMLSNFAGRSWKFYSSLAILTNVLRSVARSLFLTWSAHYGASEAAHCVKKLFPRCCSTRWGSIHETEARVLNATCAKLAHILGMVLAEKGSKKNRPKTKQLPENDMTKDLNPDTLAVEAVKEYQIKMGKWRTHALKTLEDKLFETTICIMHKTRGPVMHLSYFLKSTAAGTAVKAQSLSPAGSHLAELCSGKADEIFLEFSDLFRYLD